jgi:uncharacterized protein
MKYLLIAFSFFVLMGSNCFAQSDKSVVKIAGIPKDLSWVNKPMSWKYDQNRLTITAGPKTDLFVDPQHEYAVVNSPKAVFIPAYTFLLSGKIEVDFKTDYDAGVLVLYAGDKEWAKFCFEYSPQKKPFVVSVVNNGISDDCNHVPINGNKVYMRVAGLGNNIFAFHYSTDGRNWNLVRYFFLSAKKTIEVGFSSQSPTGASCKSSFSEISYSLKKLKDIRNGE